MHGTNTNIVCACLHFGWNEHLHLTHSIVKHIFFHIFCTCFCQFIFAYAFCADCELSLSLSIAHCVRCSLNSALFFEHLKYFLVRVRVFIPQMIFHLGKYLHWYETKCQIERCSLIQAFSIVVVGVFRINYCCCYFNLYTYQKVYLMGTQIEYESCIYTRSQSIQFLCSCCITVHNV